MSAFNRRNFFARMPVLALAGSDSKGVETPAPIITRTETVIRKFRDPRYVAITEGPLIDSALIRVKDRRTVPSGARVLVIFCIDHARVYPLSEEFRTNPRTPAFRLRAGGNAPQNPVHEEHGLWVWSAQPEA